MAESPVASKSGPAMRARALASTSSNVLRTRSDQRWVAQAEVVQHKDKVYSVAFDCKGNFFTTDTNGKRALMWHRHTHERICEFTHAEHGRMFGLAVSPDGKTLVTADYEGSCAHAFDVRKGTYIRKFPKADKKKGLLGHTSGTWALAFSPDGNQLVSGGWDNKGVIWDANEGKALYELRGHTGRVTGVAYSPHEDTAMRVVATAGFDGTVRTWEPETGDPLFSYAVPSAVAPCTGLNGVAFAPDGSSMAAAGDSGLVTIFSVSPDRGHQGRLVCELKPTRTKRDPATGAKVDLSKVLAIAYSPDSRSVATSHSDGLVRLWDLALGVEVQIMKGHGHRVIRASRYRNLWRSAGEAHGIKRRLSRVAEIAVNIEQADDVWAVAFAPRHDKHGRSIDEHGTILTGGSDKTARMWRTRNYGVCYSTFGLPGPEPNKDDGHTEAVCGVACSPDGSCFISTGFDRKVKLWDIANGLMDSVDVNETNLSAAFAPDGKRFITGGYDKCATIWSIDGARIYKQKQLKPAEEGNDLSVFCVDYHPTGHFVVTSHGDKKARVWNVDSANEEPECIKVLEDGHEGLVSCVSYSPDGLSLITGCWGQKDSKGRIWDVESEKCRVELIGHTWNLKSASWSSDGRFVITGSEDKTAIVWNARTGALVSKLVGHTAGVFAVKLVPASRKGKYHAITGGFAGDVRCWDIPSGTCERVVSLSGPATAFSFAQGVEQYARLLSSSGNAIVGLDLAAPVSPTVWANDLLRLTILPDLEERKCERTKRLCERLTNSGQPTAVAAGQTVDRSSCLLVRIGPHGETALHLALERSNFGLADVLTNHVAGGRAALVASMDDLHRTPWSIALSNLEHDPNDIDNMSVKRLAEELKKRYVDMKLVDVADNEKKKVKLMRTALKLVGSTEVYRQLCGSSGGTDDTSLEELDIEGRDTSLPVLSFEDCLRELSCGVLLGWAMATAPECDGISGDYEPPLKTFVKHANLLRSRNQYAVFDTPLAKALIRHFWKVHAQHTVQKEAALYALLVFSFTVAAVVTQTACNRVSQADTTSLNTVKTSELMTSYALNLISSGMTVLLVIRLAYREMVQVFRQGFNDYFSDFWNYFQLVSYPLAVTSTFIHSASIVSVWNANPDSKDPISCDDRAPHLRELHALAGGCVWFGLLFYMRGFDRTQTAVPIIKQICIDVYPYLFVLSTILVGCAFIFMHLLDIDNLSVDISRRYVSPSRAFLSSFEMMLGSFDVDDFTPDPRGESIIMFIVFMVFVQLVLLNMLIAIMGESVVTVNAHKNAAGLHSKCELILDCWAFMNKAQLSEGKVFPRSFPLHMHPDRTKAAKPVEHKVSKMVQSGPLATRLRDVSKKVEKIDALEEKLLEAIDAQKETERKLERILGILESGGR